MRYQDIRSYCSVCAFVAVLLLLIFTAASFAQAEVDKNPAGNEATESVTDTSSKEPKKHTPSASLTKIDQAGDELGRKVESFAEKASGRLGGWINAKAYGDISWLKLVFCLALLFAVVVFERIVRALIQRRKRQVKESGEPRVAKDYILDALDKPFRLFIWVYGIYLSLAPLFVHFRRADGTNAVHEAARQAADLGAAFALVWFVFRLVDMVDLRLRKWAESTDSSIDDMLAPLVGKTLRVFIVIIGAVLIIQNLTGVEIGPLLASLGVGGIALALAAKDSIANFFGTLTILFDKPFQVGQRVVIDSTDGTIEDVGFRSTRIRTLTGHVVTIPNEKLVNTPIENIGERPNIRWLSNLTITYDTPVDKVERAVTILREILADHEGMDPELPPRVYFNGFNDWSLNVLMVAWYHPPDYWAMQEWQQRTCLEILRRFNEEGIDFAFPSQTVYMANDDARQLKLQMLRGRTDPAEDSPIG